MKLRKIDSYRYCDDETGTYFQFPLVDLSQQQAEEWIRADMECFLGRYPSEDYFGTDRLILELGQSVPPPQTSSITLEELRAKTDEAFKDPAEKEFWMSAVERLLEHDPNFFTNLPEDGKAKILGMSKQKKLVADAAKIQSEVPDKVAPNTKKTSFR